MQSRAVVPAFLLYSFVALFAAYAARVVAANAERTAIAEARPRVVVSAPVGERTIDSIGTLDSVANPIADTGRTVRRDYSPRVGTVRQAPSAGKNAIEPRPATGSRAR